MGLGMTFLVGSRESEFSSWCWWWWCSVAQLYLILLQPYGLKPTRLLRPWDFLGKSTRVGCCFLLQGIFPTQGLNPGFPHCRQTLYHLSHQGSLKQSFIKLDLEHFWNYTVTIYSNFNLPLDTTCFLVGLIAACGRAPVN